MKILGFFTSLAMVGLIAFFLSFGAVLDYFTADLPGYKFLENYNPPVTTRVYAANGVLIGEYARQRRLYVPIEAIPQMIKNAYIAAEDKNFYRHNGVDYMGIARAVRDNIINLGSNRRPVGASTITQQVARNFLLNNQLSLRRKVSEMLLAFRIEQTFSKDKILELYLNKIYLGGGSYGVAAAALNYFGKSLQDLDIAEIAYLAALPKGPENYNPVRDKKRATTRRNWVLSNMASLGFITEEQMNAARTQELIAIPPRPHGSQVEIATYFSEDVRRNLVKNYGSQALYDGGMSVRTSLDLGMQEMAKDALVKGLVNYDVGTGWRGAVGHVDMAMADWQKKFAAIADKESLPDVEQWRLAIVSEINKDSVNVLLPKRGQDGTVPDSFTDSETTLGVIPSKYLRWAFKKAKGYKSNGTGIAGVVQIGDVVFVEAVDSGKPLNNKRAEANSEANSIGDLIMTNADEGDDNENSGAIITYRLRQFPKVSGAIIAMSPQTGRILAMVGGFSAKHSQFNRATQAYRQPGSAFKPIVYVAALDNGFTPASLVMDAPLSIYSGGKQWKPQNYSKRFYGPSTLRVGIEHSRNVMTVRLARELGMPVVAEYAEQLGIYDSLQPVLAMALGAGETTLLRLTTAYSVIANGGTKIEPSFIDRIQNRYGTTIYRHDKRKCLSCRDIDWQNQGKPPRIVDERVQILDPMSSYQIISMLKGVVKRGTGNRIGKLIKRPIAGKTGTTNDNHDSWFIGFTPDLAVGVFVGYDKPKNMGKRGDGSALAAPIFADFMKKALKNKPPVTFKVPKGMVAYRVNMHSGQLAYAGDPKSILEWFKPGSKPSSGGWQTVIGDTPIFNDDQEPIDSPALDNELEGGTGGIY